MEEQACLVRARSESETSSKLGFGSIDSIPPYNMSYSENAPGAEGDPGTVPVYEQPQEHSHTDNDSGELIDCGEAGALAQFHEDALRQTGCGLFQARVVLSCTLATAAAALELAAVPFILPSAEIELCIQEREKNWLINISLLGLSLGAAGYGALGARAGRRRALLSALAVNALFAVIAAFMPTYGTAMCARFCSAIGSGGIIPTAYTYVAEMTPRKRRTLALAPLAVGSALGSLFAALLASALLPDTGIRTLIEDKRHFSAWHRYLLLCTLPIIAALVSLIWTQESPRFLLEVGREVDAMAIYKSMHSNNHITMCGGKAPISPAPVSDYRLAELGRRRAPTTHRVAHSVKMFYQAFFQLFSPTYRNTTLSLGGTLFFAMSLQFYLSSYIPTVVLKMENEKFEASKQIIDNVTYENEYYNATIENIEYRNVTFLKCTFRDMFLSHVTFKNCSFYEVTFTNIKTSYTTFQGSLFVQSAIIDTDLEARRDLVSCTLQSSVVRGMRAPCARDLAVRLRPLRTERRAAALAQLAAAPAAAAPRAIRPLLGLGAVCTLLSPFLYVAQTETTLYAIEAVSTMLISLMLFGATVALVEALPAHLRCTGHGLVLSVCHLGAMCARAGGAAGGPAALAAAAALSLAALATLASNYERKGC